jgi:hypothetical protein
MTGPHERLRKELYLWLRPGIQILRDEDHLVFIDQMGEVVQIADSGAIAFELTERLNGQERTETLSAHPYFPIVIPLLKDRGWLVSLRDELGVMLSRYFALSREISAFAHLYPDELDWHFSLLSKKKVLIVGLGGIGAHVAFALCANGIGSLTLVDPDHIEPTNLNRQFLFSSGDVGLPKVEVVARELTDRFQATNVHAVQRNFDEPTLAAHLLQGVDLVVICGESTVLHDHPQLCRATPIMLCGYMGAVGVVGPLLDTSKGSACWPCVMGHHSRPAMRQIERLSITRQASWNPSGFAINAMTGSICSQICVGFLSEQPSALKWVGIQLKTSCMTLDIDKKHVEPLFCEHSIASS